MKIAFIHPDLGIGGAERLIVDAAMGLLKKGHEIVIYTSHHDSNHCFTETKTELKVIVYGDFLPRNVFGYGHILFAILRNLYLCFCIFLESLNKSRHYDLFIVDQLSISIPLLRWTGSKILFYCHFPDKLLTQRKTIFKKLYRLPFDFLEQITTSMNSFMFVFMV